MEPNLSKESLDLTKLVIELGYVGVPDKDVVKDDLEKLESRFGLDFPDKETMEALFTCFYEGMQQVLNHERSRYGERLKNFKVPIVLRFVPTKSIASYHPNKKVIIIHIPQMVSFAHLPLDRKVALGTQTETLFRGTSAELYRMAGREEMDHAIFHFLHPDTMKDDTTQRKQSLSEYDSLPHEYHALGMSILLGEKLGDDDEIIEANRKRLHNALPLRKRDIEHEKKKTS